ncbi:ABC transporter transmembrane region [Bacteriovorax sp. DB6_IX]|nr:ABC transporter transmembrane domain-containing protein [Bacteriovorax sp. DB6_IX]EQC52473.1 ABC transporter transmembrane region [Bacteriovorax sp. DB6_IX]
MWHLLKNYLYPYIHPYRYRVFCAIILSFILASLGAANVRLIQLIFDEGISANSNFNDILKLAGLLLGINLINFPCRFFHFYWIRFVVLKATCAIQEDLFKKIQKMPVSYFTQSKQGNIISILVNDTHIFSSGFRASIDLLREPLKAMAFLGMAFYYDWQLTFVIFVVAPFLVAIFGVSGKKLKITKVMFSVSMLN